MKEGPQEITSERLPHKYFIDKSRHGTTAFKKCIKYFGRIKTGSTVDQSTLQTRRKSVAER